MTEIISERLKALRESRHVTQKALATAVGISEIAYRRYELGLRQAPRLEQLVALADYFDVSLDYLVGRSDDPARH